MEKLDKNIITHDTIMKKEIKINKKGVIMHA